MNNLKTTILITCTLSLGTYVNYEMYKANNNEPALEFDHSKNIWPSLDQNQLAIKDSLIRN